VKANVTTEMNENECNAIKYVSQEELKELIKKAEKKEDGVTITPWFSLIGDKFLFKWWDHVDTIEQFRDTETIHRFL